MGREQGPANSLASLCLIPPFVPACLRAFVPHSASSTSSTFRSSTPICEIAKRSGQIDLTADLRSAVRSLSVVIHPHDRVGSVANYVGRGGRWINNRGEAGPFSQPVRMVLAIPGQSSLSEAA